MQLTLTLKVTTAQVVETSVTVNNNSPIQDCVHPDDQTQPTYEMTPGFKPFTEELYVSKKVEENAGASEGKLIMPTRNNNGKKVIMCVTTSQPEKKAAKITFAQFKRRTLQSIIYTPEENIRWNKQHLVRGKSGVLPTDPLFTL